MSSPRRLQSCGDGRVHFATLPVQLCVSVVNDEPPDTIRTTPGDVRTTLRTTPARQSRTMTRQHLTPTLTALNREWGALCDEHTTLPARWRLACGREATEAGLAGILGAIGADPDAVLLGLLTLHRGGDRLAGRVVLQAFVGKLVLMAASDPTATLPDYLAAVGTCGFLPCSGRRRCRSSRSSTPSIGENTRAATGGGVARLGRRHHAEPSARGGGVGRHRGGAARSGLGRSAS